MFRSIFLLSLSAVSVGYEYETCPSLVLWEKRTAVLQGYELEPSNLGGWSLDKHHILNLRSGMAFFLTDTHKHTQGNILTMFSYVQFLFCPVANTSSST